MSTHNNVHETAAGAGNSRAMESGDHLSNGVSPKRGNFFICERTDVKQIEK